MCAFHEVKYICLNINIICMHNFSDTEESKLKTFQLCVKHLVWCLSSSPLRKFGDVGDYFGCDHWGGEASGTE